METMGRWQRESLSLPRCRHSYVGTNMAQRVLNSSIQENVHLTKARRAAGRDRIRRLDVGLPPIKLLLRLTKQLHVQHMVFVEATFPSKVLGAVQV